jgi:hypothetical protein
VIAPAEVAKAWAAVDRRRTDTIAWVPLVSLQRALHAVRRAYSHSMVAGGFEVRSSTTRLISRTSLVIRVEIRSSTS